MNGLATTNAYDGWNRAVNVKARLGASTLGSVDYAFDAAGRLGASTAGTYSATYNYLAHSPLVGQLDFKQSGTVRMSQDIRFVGPTGIHRV